MSKTDADTDTDSTDEQAAEQAEEKLHIETGGDMFKSLTGLLNAFVDEAKFRFDPFDADDPTLSVQAVDPANVGMVSVEIPAEAFDSYAVPNPLTIGMNLDTLSDTTGYAHKGGNSSSNPGDPVILEQVGDRIYVRVEPEDRMIRTGSFFGIDPDSIRKEPEIPELELPWRGDVPADQLRDAIHEIDSRFDHVRFSAVVEESGNGSLGEDPQGYLSLYAMNRGERKPAGKDTTERYVSEEDEFRTPEKVMTGDEDALNHASLFSNDYLKDMTSAIVKAGFETVTVEFGDEFPMFMQFREDRWGMEATFLLAPRITSDGSESERPGRLDDPTWGDRFDGGDD